MKKTIKKIITLLIIILISSIVAVSGLTTMTYSPNEGENFIMPKDKKTIGVSTWGWKTDFSSEHRTEKANTQYSILDYANVFCVEANMGFLGQENYAMSVCGPYTWSTNTATNKMEKGLIYLLAQYDKYSAMNYGYKPVQLALWNYLDEYKDNLSDGIKDIVYQGSYSSDSLKLSSTSHSEQYNKTDEAKKLYNNAKKYSGSPDYKVTFYILTASGGQKILVVESAETESKVDVSLQKYITQVNGTNVAQSRENKGTKGYNNIIYNKNIKKSVTVPASNESYKNNKPVMIEQGDEVTYKVLVYNNGSEIAKNVTVTDTLPNSKYIELEKTVLKQGENCTQISRNENTVTADFKNIESGKAGCFYITVKFKDEYFEDQIWNIAKITSTTPENNTTFRTQDGDSIKMEKPTVEVSLQKFIAKVEDSEPDIASIIGGKEKEQEFVNEGYVEIENKNANRIRRETGISGYKENNYAYSSTRDDNIRKQNNEKVPNDNKLRSFKYNNPVLIEAGQYVAYNLYVYNNGKNTAKNVTVTDTLPGSEFIENYSKDVKVYILDKDQGKNADTTYGNGQAYTISGNILTAKFKDIKPNDYGRMYVVIHFTKYSTAEKIWNIAEITGTGDQINAGKDNSRQLDGDSVKMKEYKVSLEKYVSEITDTKGSKVVVSKNRTGREEYKTRVNGNLKDNTEQDKEWTQHNWEKYSIPVEVSHNDTVTYNIRVKNDGETTVAHLAVKDTLPQTGVDLNNVSISSSAIRYNKQGKEITNGITPCTGSHENGSNICTIEFPQLELSPGQSIVFQITVKVTEPNISLNVLKNTAEITSLQNRFNILVEDKTPWNNKDSDYIQMKDITIEGNVWNDLRDDTKEQKYDGKFDEGRDVNLEGIKVDLYRLKLKDAASLVSIGTQYTDKNGYYSFSSANINATGYEKYIKAPKISKSINRWNQEYGYYSYYVVFEYDGIKYTTTPDGKSYVPISVDTSTTNYIKDNNAREKSNSDKSYDGFGGIQTREDFNAKFSTINGNSGIEYTTKNEDGNVPQSIYKSNPEMLIKSSTNLIKLENNTNLEEQIKHIDMGLRGRDAFDLHLTDYASSVKVTVNGKSNTYKEFADIEAKKATIRKTDIVEGTKNIGKEDAANVSKEVINDNKYILKEEQKIRTTDIKNDAYKEVGTGLDIFVTYKITVTNASITSGTASKVTDYYDKMYEFKSCYYIDENNVKTDLKTEEGTSSKDGYNSRVITTQQTTLKSDGSMDIYVVFKLKDASNTLEKLLSDQSLPTFNMAEITEYKTQCGENQTEFTRGLIDINSAPDSANKEQVRTQDTIGQDTPTVNGNPTTVNAFFTEANKLRNGQDNYVERIKYEDDTYIAPMLYFVADGNARTITGTIFEDNTSVNDKTKIRSGDGKLGKDESKINDVQVDLIEVKDGKKIVRYTTNSNEDGSYTFSGFIPGDYIIKYVYGNSEENVIVNGTNTKSYNGEDFQATNNEELTKIINSIDEPNRVYWYVKNGDGYSVGTDDKDRRNQISNWLTTVDSDARITVLNNMRAGKSAEDSKVTYKDENGEDETVDVDDIILFTMMDANTTQKMSVEVEAVNNEFKQSDVFGEYKIENMNFGIAQVPVTTIDLQKHIKAITIKDSANTNTIAKLELKDNGEWTIEGDIIGPDKVNKTINFADISIEEEKMQGAKLEVTYEISSSLNVEKNFDNTDATVATITGLVDFINNNLSYNQELSYNNVKNSDNWEIITRDKLINGEFAKANNPEGLETKGTVDPEGTKYTTIVKAKTENSILTNTIGTGKATITLEKVLSSSNATFEEIITSTVGSEEYGNIVEITSMNYQNTKIGGKDGTIQRDRVIIPSRFIPLAGIQYDWAEAEPITIHEPTGVGNSINTTYYVLAVISLVVLAGGVFGIKKFVLKK